MAVMTTELAGANIHSSQCKHLYRTTYRSPTFAISSASCMSGVMQPRTADQSSVVKICALMMKASSIVARWPRFGWVSHDTRRMRT